MKEQIRHTGKKWICGLLSLCLCIALTGILLTTGISFGFFRDTVFLRAMSSRAYYEQLSEQLQGDLEQVVAAYHIPAQAVEGVIDADQVYLDGYDNLTHAIIGKNYEADITHITTDLQSCLETYATAHGIEAEEAVKLASDSITHAMSQEYGRMLSFPFANAYHTAKHICRQISVLIYSICGAVALICSTLLLFLHHRRYHGMREIDHALLGAVISAGAIGGLAAYELMHMQLLNEPNAYAGMIRSYFTEALQKGFWSIIVGAAIWFALMIVTHEMREKRI